MNIDKGHNVFSDVPGFDSSKGERIIKALRRLWMKIQHLEQVRISEKKAIANEVQTDLNADSDLTLTDVQFKLLVLQLQYIRSILQKRHTNPVDSDIKAHSNISEKRLASNINVFPDSHSNNIVCCADAISSKETQTGVSLIEGFLNDAVQYKENADDVKIAGKKTLSRSSNVIDSTYDSSTFMPTKLKLSSQPHYHLKLDDVPFILGASSSASHSVVANVQNIIAMMKSHNRALCGPKTRIKHSLTLKGINLNKQEALDTNKMLKELSQELSELSVKQQKLKQMFDHVQNKDHVKDTERRSKVKTDSGPDIASGCRLRTASAASTKLHSDFKQYLKTKDKNISKRCHSQPSHVIPIIRGNSNSGSIIARRKLLRSLQDFKSHLSEDDISWN